MSSIFDKLTPIVHRYEEIEAEMGRPEVAVNFERIQELAKERASLDDLVAIARRYEDLTVEQKDLKALVEEGGDPELVDMAREEMDSVDAALDETNVVRFCEALEELAQETQFLVITHNRVTMERADALYGVSATDDGVSQVISLRSIRGARSAGAVAAAAG